jgi:hypothetical protein
MARRGRFRMNNSAAKELRRKDALKRAEARVGLSDQDKLSALDKNLGVGVGAKRERAKLLARIAGPKKVAQTAAEAPKPEVTVKPIQLLVEGEVGLEVRAGQVTLIVGERKPVPVISMSQLRRLADQHEFDASGFLKAFKAHLATTETR